MAKRGTLEHPKTLDLAERLDIMEPFALGILEAFWNYVSKYHTNGDVTALRPALLVRSIRYKGDAEHLWNMLIDCGLVDRNRETGALTVHDWSEHADDTVNTMLARRCERFADGTVPSARRLNKDERERFNHWLAEGTPTTAPQNADKMQTRDADMADAPPEVAASLTVPSQANTDTKPEEKPFALASPAPAAENPKLALVPAATQRQCAGVDPRFTPFRAAIAKHWSIANPNDGMPWDGSEAKRLNEFLKSCPTLDLVALERMLENRRRSEVVQSYRPRTWICRLTDYANGPIDRYGKPMAVSHPEASVGSYRPPAVEDPVMDLAWEADRDSRVTFPLPEPGVPDEPFARHVAVAQIINRARRHPLRCTEAEIRGAVEKIFEMRNRVNRILHEPEVSHAR